MDKIYQISTAFLSVSIVDFYRRTTSVNVSGFDVGIIQALNIEHRPTSG